MLGIGTVTNTNLTPFTAAEAKVRESRWSGRSQSASRSTASRRAEPAKPC